MIIPIILSGGNGTRLWPLSRRIKPKQFISLFNEDTMFTETISRFKNKEIFDNPVILGNINHEKFIIEEFEKNGVNGEMVLEPKPRNTAPAICSIVEYMMTEGKGEDIVVFLPADAYIDNSKLFEDFLVEGQKLANENKIACFGIQPLYPETGYGYIKLDKKINGNSFLVEKFVEKPNLEKAEQFVESNNYLWNAGIFMGKVSFLHELFKKYQNDLLENIKLTLSKSVKKDNKLYLDEENFLNSKDISIDYAIIENLNSTNLAVISMNIIWSDVGSYKSLYDTDKNKTDSGNIIKGKAVVHDSKNCYISSSKKTICCSDVENLVIVEDGDIILVMDKNKSQNIKKLIENIKKEDISIL